MSRLKDHQLQSVRDALGFKTDVLLTRMEDSSGFPAYLYILMVCMGC